MRRDELVEVAVERTLATGRHVAVVGFTNADTAHVVDLDPDGEVEATWAVPVDPSPEPNE